MKNKNAIGESQLLRGGEFSTPIASPLPRSKKVKRICQQCGKEFEIYFCLIKHGGGKFCSKKCVDKNFKKKIKRTCESCGKTFEIKPSIIKKGGGKFCSIRCVKKGKTRVKRKCLVCGREFFVKLSILKKGWGKCCSFKCKSIAHAYGEKIIQVCHQCGKEFAVFPSRVKKGGAMFCSKKCSGANTYKKIEKVCQQCGMGFMILPSSVKQGRGKFCSNKCRGKYSRERNNNHISEIIRHSLRYKEWRQQVFIRDDFSCQKCGDNSGGDLNAHHKKPFSILLQEALNYMPLFSPYEAVMAYTPLWNIENGITLCEKCHKKTKSYGRQYYK